jgi:hypothetical protein
VLKLCEGASTRHEADRIADAIVVGQPTRSMAADARDERARLFELVVHTLAQRGARPACATVVAAIDQAQSVVLELAGALEPASRKRVDQRLRAACRGQASFDDALEEVSNALGDRPVLVDRIDLLFHVEDDQLSGAIANNTRALRRWLDDRAALISSTSVGDPRRIDDAKFAGDEAAPVVLTNGQQRSPRTQWSAVRDPVRYELALVVEAISDASDDVDLSALDEHNLRSVLWRRLHQRTQSLLQYLAADARPMPRSVLARLPDYNEATLARGEELGLWVARPESVRCPRGWAEWIRREFTKDALLETHRALANAYSTVAIPEDESSGLEGFAVLGAQRHLIAIGDRETALRFAQYGAELFIDEARRLSSERKFGEASKIYQQLLEHNLVHGRLRAYAKHYLHFNRAHDTPPRESVTSTAAAYEESLRDWPENVLFRSRTIRAWVLAEDFTRAERLLDEARTEAPQHTHRDALLYARTARRLVELQRPTQALMLLGDYVPSDGEAERAREEFGELVEALDRGWRSSKIGVAEGESLSLLRDVWCRAYFSERGWKFVAEHLGASAFHRRPADAIREVARSVRDEVRALLVKLDRELDDEELDRKVQLLATVDIIASCLDAPASDTVWVFGKVKRDEHGLWLETAEDDVRFAIDGDRAETVVVNDDYHLAKVKAGPSGVPQGSVIELERFNASDEGDVRRRWRELRRHDA